MHNMLADYVGKEVTVVARAGSVNAALKGQTIVQLSDNAVMTKCDGKIRIIPFSSIVSVQWDEDSNPE